MTTKSMWKRKSSIADRIKQEQFGRVESWRFLGRCRPREKLHIVARDGDSNSQGRREFEKIDER